MKQFTLGIENEIIVDNFAGGGGASLGYGRAGKRRCDYAGVRSERERHGS